MLWEKSVDPAKVTLGLAFYGRTYTVQDTKSCPSTGCIATGLGSSGLCDDSPGYLSYDQVLNSIEDDTASPTFDEDAAIKWIAYEDSKQWLYYDDKETFAKKVDFANKHCLGGMMTSMLTSHRDLTTRRTQRLGYRLGRQE
jgi:chitinase